MNAVRQIDALTRPGAQDINGVPHLQDAKGRWVPLSAIRPIDLLMDEMVRKVASYADDLSAELARFKTYTDADIAAFDALIVQEFKAEAVQGVRGNRTFLSFDGLTMLKVAVSDRIVLGPELQAAKAVLDAIIRRRGEGADTFLVTLVKRAFQVDQEGRVDVPAILALRRMDVDDPAWPDFCAAIDASVRIIGSKRYVRLYRREIQDGSWRMIPLDLAAVEPSPAAFARKTLRRQVEELTEKVELAANALSLADLYAQDGTVLMALAKAEEARSILGGVIATGITSPQPVNPAGSIFDEIMEAACELHRSDDPPPALNITTGLDAHVAGIIASDGVNRERRNELVRAAAHALNAIVAFDLWGNEPSADTPS